MRRGFHVTTSPIAILQPSNGPCHIKSCCKELVKSCENICRRGCSPTQQSFQKQVKLPLFILFTTIVYHFEYLSKEHISLHQDDTCLVIFFAPNLLFPIMLWLYIATKTSFQTSKSVNNNFHLHFDKRLIHQT
jgi:hypothetical protein